MNQFSRMGLLTVATFSLVTLKTDLAEAAAYGFNFGYSFYGNRGNGYLNFTDSPLTGIGTETVSFDALIDAVFSVSYYTVLPISGSPDVYLGSSSRNGIFTFESGNLVGVDLLDAGSDGFGYTEGRYGPPYYSGGGTANLSLKGDKFETYLSYQETVIDYELVIIYDDDGNPIGSERREFIADSYYVPHQTIQEDSIDFYTIEPLNTNAAPEPLTILGTGIALGYGTFFKRKLSKKSKPE